MREVNPSKAPSDAELIAEIRIHACFDRDRREGDVCVPKAWLLGVADALEAAQSRVQVLEKALQMTTETKALILDAKMFANVYAAPEDGCVATSELFTKLASALETATRGTTC